MGGREENLYLNLVSTTVTIFCRFRSLLAKRNALGKETQGPTVCMCLNVYVCVCLEEGSRKGCRKLGAEDMPGVKSDTVTGKTGRF